MKKSPCGTVMFNSLLPVSKIHIGINMVCPSYIYEESLKCALIHS